MRTTTGRKTAHRRLGRGLSLGFEPLEPRLTLSASSSVLSATIPSTGSLAIVSTSPADSAVLSSSPTSLQVIFDRPLSEFSLSNEDFELVRVAGDGSTTPVQGGGAELEESLDPDGSRIDLEVSTPLTLGRYQLLLGPESQIQGLDGSTLALAGSSRVVDDFTVATTEPGLASATDLGTLGPSETVVPGQLNLAADPGAVQYHKFEVAAGHHWLVGLEVAAAGAGATMDASISLFDASGHLISTANLGLAGEPGEPFLFAGLDPGTYYVGVAASKNLPDASGTYDPANLEVGGTNPGGPFQLEAVADVDDQPTQVLGLRLDHADPLSTAPTGLTLEFSGGLAPASLESAGASPLVLVDQSGATWSLTPSQYDASDGQLSLDFDRPLAAGTYSVELAGADSLLDLAGRAPVAKGLPGGTLGTFVVARSTRAAGDLGAVLPGLGSSGLGSTVNVTPRAETTEPFVIVEPGVYAFDVTSPDGGARYSIEDGSGNVLVDSTNQGRASYLAAGSYQVVLTTAGSSPTAASISIAQRLADRSSLLDTGVAQSPALSLRLVTPQANFGQDSSAPTASAAPPVTIAPAGTSGPAAGTNPVGRSASVAGGPSVEPAVGTAVSLTTPGSPGVAGILGGAGLVGRPSPSTSLLGVVGLAGSRLAAAASNPDHLPAGLIVAEAPEPEGFGEAGATLESGLLARSPESRREDESSLADLGRIGRLLADALERLAPNLGVASAEASEPGPSVAGATPTGPEPLDGDRTAAASVGTPLALGVAVGAIVIGSRRKLRKRKPTVPGPQVAADDDTILRGPHGRCRGAALAR